MPTRKTTPRAPATPIGGPIHKRHILSDDGALCGSSARTWSRDWALVTCPACLKRAPKGPAKAELSEDELDIALDALRVWAARERDLALHDCWGDSLGQRQKHALYLKRIAIAERLEKRLGKEVR